MTKIREKWGPQSELTRRSRFVLLLVVTFPPLMLASLRWGFLDPFFFGSDGRSVQGIDFFSTPKAYLNLLEGRSMFDSWRGTPYGPYSTWYVMHPALAVVVGSWLSLFPPWVSYGLFTVVSFLVLVLCGRLVASLGSDRFERRMAYAFFLCSFLTYWLLYVGNVHAMTVLSITLMLVGMYELAYGREPVDAIRATGRIRAGLLLSLFSKPLVLLTVPVLLMNRVTRRQVLLCLGIYGVVSLVFLFVPSLNPESVGLRRMIELVTAPEFVRQHLNVYANNFTINVDMKDNLMHWLHIVAQSGASWNHVDIFSLSALVNSALGVDVPGVVYKGPVVVVVLLSMCLVLVRDERERMRVSLLVVIAGGFSFFLSYNVVWEYQYASLFPCVATLFLMYRRGYVAQRVGAAMLLLCIFYYLPSPYVLVRERTLGTVELNVVRSTRVIPSLLCFVAIVGVAVERLWVQTRGPIAPRRGDAT